MRSAVQFLIYFVFVLNGPIAFAGGDHDHSAQPKGLAQPKSYFTSVSNSDKYELLLKYKHIETNEDATMQLFVSEFNTNKPVDKADIKIICAEDKNIKL